MGFLFFLALLKKPKESPTILGFYPSIHCMCIHFEYINQRQIQRPKLQWSKSLIILMKVDICKVNDDHVHGFLGISPRGAVFFSLFLARLSKIKTTPLGLFASFWAIIMFLLMIFLKTYENRFLRLGFFSVRVEDILKNNATPWEFCRETPISSSNNPNHGIENTILICRHNHQHKWNIEVYG